MTTLPIKLNGCKPTPVGLEFSEGITFKEWDSVGRILSRLEDGLTWWVGDWIAYGEKSFKGRIEIAQVASGFSWKTLYNANYVSINVPISRRRELLSWQHHAEVAALEPTQQQKWLTLAERHQMSVRRLRASIRAGRVLSDEECGGLGKNGGIISLTALCVKLRLWQKRAPDITTMDMDQLEEAHRNLAPFVETDQRIQDRLKELRHVPTVPR